MRSIGELRPERESHAAVDWTQTYASLSEADREGDLGAEDLRRLGVAAELTGHHDVSTDAWERAHHAFLEEGDLAAAARCAFWLAVLLFRYGQHAPGAGWLGRIGRLLEGADRELVEHGYLLIPQGLQALDGGDPQGALETFQAVATIADRYEDPDLKALSRLGQGRALVAAGRPADGVSMLDAAMVSVTAGDVSPLPAGIVYCGVILVCQQVFDLRRAQEWTVALSRWCARQHGMQPYRGQCLVHRSQIMQLRGDWSDAMEEADRACAHLARPPNDPVMGMARYQQAELLRLQGDFPGAEEAYRLANEWGHAVQPGLALLRLAQGRVDDAESAIRRVVEESGEDRVVRSRVLAAFVEIVLAADDQDAAREATSELEELAADLDAPYLHAVAASARGAVMLADGDANGAREVLRDAWFVWRQLDAPYEAARVRLMMAEACRDLGDRDTADMELDAARRTFEQLGAAPDLARVAELDPGPGPAAPGGLTPREVEVLQLVATGATNREIAGTLVISEKTVARHLSNMFTKLDVPSRAAATAWAYENGVV
ncbi:MAG: LuxR C-terminal-related transcriptional regulator [Actinobacteria bacterium]|nr:LuxR C-terminal-related transcriptional regulator [Actinomycetota bacterium]